MSESRAHRLKRMRMRSWRRGTKEMDLILGPYADRMLATLSVEELDLFDEMLEENDQDLYQWASGQAEAPQKFSSLIKNLIPDS